MLINHSIRFKNLLTRTCGILLTMLAIISCTQQTPQEKKTEIKKDTAKIYTKEKTSTQKTSTQKKEFVRIYNDNARFIAGMKSDEGSEFLKLEKNQDWRIYASWFNNGWTALEERQLSKIKSWSEKELTFNNPASAHSESHSDMQGYKTVFYPFSGADFLYADTFFPAAENYIMIGLEPVGKIPDIRKIPSDFWENYFLALRKAQSTILSSSFFKTRDMRTDFQIQELKGTLPLLMVYLARTGNKIITIEPVQVNDSGQVIKSTFPQITWQGAGKMNGVQITFEVNRGNDSLSSVTKNSNETASVQKTLYYFSFDLSDKSLQKKNGLEIFLNSFSEAATFIKSASYLMHQPNFETIHKIILNHSQAVLQDDSGIPVHFFAEQENWQKVQYYGTYNGPIPMFKKFYQTDLKNAFNDTSKVKPLPFGIGYQRKVDKSNLLIAKKTFPVKS